MDAITTNHDLARYPCAILGAYEPHLLLQTSRFRRTDEIHGINISERVEWRMISSHLRIGDTAQILHESARPDDEFGVL